MTQIRKRLICAGVSLMFLLSSSTAIKAESDVAAISVTDELALEDLYAGAELVIQSPPIIKNEYQNIIDNFSEGEKELLLNIVYAEAGNQTIEGQRAIIEIIFNRMLSEDFPNSLEGVLSQKRQFSTWRVRNKVKRNDTPAEALQLVYNNEENILPSKNYLYFNTTKQSYAYNYIQIGDHWFGSKREE